jgi:hypothetical protein
MNSNLEKIKELVLGSELEPSDMEELLIALLRVEDDKDLADVLELFTNDPTWIAKISANLKAKSIAAMTGDAALWDEILNEQVVELEKLSDE